MDIVFSGICCFVDVPPPNRGKTVIVRNALQGGTHRGNAIPPHYAFLHAKCHHVDSRNWGSGWLASEDNVLLWLTGDYVTFDPMPCGGSIDLSALPHVVDARGTDPICPAAAQIRSGFFENPSAANVLALIHVPADAPVTSTTNVKGAAYATLHLGDGPVTITATPFADGTGGPRSVTVTDPNAQLFLCNVDINSYLIGSGADDDTHKYLVCDVFRPATLSPQLPLRPPAVGPVPSLASIEPDEESALDQISLRALRGAANRNMPDFLSTFAAGCSASQWP